VTLAPAAEITGSIQRGPVLHDIQDSIAGELDAVAREMARIVSYDVPLLSQISAHLMAMRGKMFRPTLVLLASRTAGRPDPRAVTLAAAVELIHLATLVHDDAIDHSVLRRGMPTLNSLFSHQVSVIMGDFIYSSTLSELVNIGDIGILQSLTRASTDMTLGEMRQLAGNEALSFSEADYFALIRAKTASLMSAACDIGAQCGAAVYREQLAKYGEALGMVFQIADDLIDYTEAQETAGKPTGLDLKEHKVTLPLIASLKKMKPQAKRRVEALFASPEPSDASIADVIGLVEEHGGLEYARAKGEYFAGIARAALSDLPDTVARRALLDSISYVMERHS
jgi:octaprenyl-diphosphate synthase